MLSITSKYGQKYENDIMSNQDHTMTLHSYTLKQCSYQILTSYTLRFLTVLILGISKSGGDPPPLHKMWGRG